MAPIKRNEFGQNILETVCRKTKREKQLQLIKQVHDDKGLSSSKIIPTTRVRVGVKYKFEDLEKKKQEVLEETRKTLLTLSMEEAKRDIVNLDNKQRIEYDRFSKEVSEEQQQLLANQIKESRKTIEQQMDKRFDKKLKFHGSQVEENHACRASPGDRRQRNKSGMRKKKDRVQNRKNRAKTRKEEIRKKVDEIIDDNVIVNFSSYKPPDLAYLYLDSKRSEFCSLPRI